MREREPQNRCLLEWTYEEPFELGAGLISLLAFPDPTEIARRKQAFEALCAQTIHATCNTDLANAASWRARFPAYAAIDKADVKRRLNTVKRRLRDRMKAAQMAQGYFDEALRHMFAWMGEAYPDMKPEIGDIDLRPTPLPEGMERHSANALVKFHFPHSNDDGWHNREQRIWRLSLPVIHLAVAVHVLGRHRENATGDFGYDLADLHLHWRVLGLAKVHEEGVDFEWGRRKEGGQKGSSTFVIDPSVLIRCRAQKPLA